MKVKMTSCQLQTKDHLGKRPSGSSATNGHTYISPGLGLEGPNPGLGLTCILKSGSRALQIRVVGDQSLLIKGLSLGHEPDLGLM